MQGDIEDSVVGTVADGSNGLLVAGLGAAASRAVARTAMAIAARPTPGTTRTQMEFQVKLEATEAVESAVNSVASDKPVLAELLSHRVSESALQGFKRNYEFQDGDWSGVKRKAAADRTRLFPRRSPPPRRSGSGAVRLAETVTIDGAGDDEEDRMAAPPNPSPSRNEAVLRSSAAESAPGVAAEAGAAERRPVGAPSAGGPEENAADADADADGAGQPHQPARSSSSTGEIVVPGLAAARAPIARSAEVDNGNANSNGRGIGVGGAVAPPERPARKRRKSAEAGGWRSRYNKDEFESGDALLASSDGESDEGWRVTDGDADNRASGNGGDDEEDAESDELVDVGVEEDDDLYVDGGGGGGWEARNRKVAAEPVKKRNPPNAWKRRCADGDCQLGASFGLPGTPAKYCSSHKDAGMVNVTHRRCEEPGCVPCVVSFVVRVLW